MFAKGCPSSLPWRMSTISRGRTRLPTWVVRIRLWLIFIVLTPPAVVSNDAGRRDFRASGGQGQGARAIEAYANRRYEWGHFDAWCHRCRHPHLRIAPGLG